MELSFFFSFILWQPSSRSYEASTSFEFRACVRACVLGCIRTYVRTYTYIQLARNVRRKRRKEKEKSDQVAKLLEEYAY